MEHAKKREIPQKYWNRLQKGEEIETEDGAHYTPDMVLGAARKGIKVTYCTDTRPTESLVASISAYGSIISIYLISNGSSGAIIRSAPTTRSNPFGPIIVRGSVRSALPMERSNPGSPLI